MDNQAFTFEYHPATIQHGSGVVSNLTSTLEANDCSRALVVTDESLADIPTVMDPIKEGLGDYLIEVCDAVTPEKFLKSGYEGAQIVEAEGIDALVPVGGGSSLDVAKQVSFLAGHTDPLEDVAESCVDNTSMATPPDGQELLDIFAIPTTFPGADLSQVAGVTYSLDPAGKAKDEIPSGGFSDQRLMPTVVLQDVDLFATTPDTILARSAMNGFDKGIEMLYTRHHTPITDGTAIRGVRLLYEYLPRIMADETSQSDLSHILRGIAAAQYGLSTPQRYRASVIHSFGHAIARNYEVQQGVAHAVAAPHVLRYLFEQVDGRRALLAEAFGVHEPGASPEAMAEGIVDAVAETRDALELPSKLRSIEGVQRDHFPRLAQAVIEDPFMEVGPRKLEAKQDDIEAVFEAMW